MFGPDPLVEATKWFALLGCLIAVVIYLAWHMDQHKKHEDLLGRVDEEQLSASDRRRWEVVRDGFNRHDYTVLSKANREWVEKLLDRQEASDE